MKTHSNIDNPTGVTKSDSVRSGAANPIVKGTPPQTPPRQHSLVRSGSALSQHILATSDVVV